MPVTSEKEFILSTSSACEPFVILALTCKPSKLLPNSSNSTRPSDIPDNSTKFEAVTPIPNRPKSFDNCSAICPAIIPLSKSTLILWPLDVATITGLVNCVRVSGNVFAA